MKALREVSLETGTVFETVRFLVLVLVCPLCCYSPIQGLNSHLQAILDKREASLSGVFLLSGAILISPKWALAIR